MYLGSYAQSRDNNFNLLRFIAASLVLVSHSYALSTGSAAAEPLRESLGVTWGVLAVDVFFLISGFLVTNSLLVRQSLTDFAVARFLRIFPGLWVALGLTVAVAGAFVTTLPPQEFLVHSGTWQHVVKNATLVKISYTLPGVFENLPWKGAVNGSLWTLPFEIRMYALLAGVWFAIRCLRFMTPAAFGWICIAIAVGAGTANIASGIAGSQDEFVRLGYFFFAGAAFRVLQARIRMSRTAAAAMLLAIGLAALDRRAFGVVYPLLLPYAVLYVAMVPGGFIRRFNRLGDYSYGIYIYAFPVQQMLAFAIGGIGPYPMMAGSFAITLALAVASWTLVEKPALAWKRQPGDAPRKRGVRLTTERDVRA